MAILESIKEVYRKDQALGLAIATAWNTCNPTLTEGWISKALATAGIIGAGAMAGHKLHADAQQKVHEISDLLKTRTELSHHLDTDEDAQRYQNAIKVLKSKGVSVVKKSDGNLLAIDTDGNEYDGTTGEILK